MKRILCGDLVPGCGFKAQAATDADVLSIELAHAREIHGISVTPGFLERARERIQDVSETAKENFSREAAHRG